MTNKCKYCEKEINNKGSLAAHEKQCKLNPDRIPRIRSPKAGAQKNSIPWNKGLKDDPRCEVTQETVVKILATKKLKNIPLGKGATPELELERIRKITEKAKLNNGGLRQGSGRGKQGWYKSIYCDSSWELAFVIYHIDNNILIERCKEVRSYTFENKIKNYYPDFVVNNKIYEIKGYTTAQSDAKALFNPDIEILNKDKIAFYLNYVVDKYGKNFISLYEK